MEHTQHRRLRKPGIGGYAGNNNYSGKGIGTAVAKCDMNIRSVAEVKSNTVYSSIKAGKVEVLEVLANSWYKIVWAAHLAAMLIEIQTISIIHIPPTAKTTVPAQAAAVD